MMTDMRNLIDAKPKYKCVQPQGLGETGDSLRGWGRLGTASGAGGDWGQPHGLGETGDKALLMLL